MDNIKYYNQNADTYFELSLKKDMTDCCNLFLDELPDKPRILDVGCGSGRDMRYFSQKGCVVNGIDASKELVKLATNYTGLSVKCLRIQELIENNIYDGVWCCASLLHIPKQEMQSVYNRLWRSLKNKGICFVSYKSEIINKNDKRLFTCYDQKSLKKFINNSTNFLIKKIWTSKSEDNWVNALLLK